MKKAIITGAGGGIGKTFCEVFYKNGYEVFAIDRKDFELTVPHHHLNVDINELYTKPELLKKEFDEIDRKLDGRLNVIINNAAVQIVKPIEEVHYSDWTETLNSNLLSPYFLVQRFLPHLRAVKGSVINIASIHWFLTKKNFCLYATSKGAMVTMTKALALDLAPDVRVNALIPAATDTPMLRAGFEGDLDGFAQLEEYHPLQRIATPEEVAEVGLFLAGDKSTFMTGSVVNVDGGIGSVLHDPATKR